MTARPSKFIAFDLESGGLTPAHPDIQLAAVAIDEATWGEIDVFQRKIQFNIDQADPHALEINHYDPAVWEREAVTEHACVSEFRRFVDRHKSLDLWSQRTSKTYPAARLVGHNAATFDGPRLKAMFDRHGYFLPADLRVRCTVQRALWFFDEHPELARPRDMKLATLATYFGIPVAGAHDALADVRLTIALARALAGAAINTEVRS